MSLSQRQIKLITSLSKKKYRKQHGLFVAEGVKVVNELLASDLELSILFCTPDFNCDLQLNVEEVSENDLKKISTLKSPNKVLALFKIPESNLLDNKGITVALDAINDPGNLGTIIRLCDWYGIDQIVCSEDTVDCYNQKVIQSTMGSITRVTICYLDLPAYLATVQVPVYAADMHGENVYKSELPSAAVLVMGNEANGISKEVATAVSDFLTIPRFGTSQKTESLNVSTATAILLSEFKRNS
ncbi:MAG: RNA methyltransferase [Flavobacteriaceae bacterium]|nr:MAG: RNA methyltransferase [Flavobacteriaceae bacterium]